MHKMKKSSFLRIGLTLISFFLFSQSLSQTLTQTEKTPLPKKTNIWKNIETSIDSLFNIYLSKEEPIQGAVISIVSSDSILVSKGYGLADITTNTAFDPMRTNVMVASVSKLITATAIFQLIEKGDIQLDQPVAELIGDLEIDNPFNQPVLIKHILTHTAGFDDATIGSESKNLDQLKPLKEHLAKRLPPIVWEPGKYYNYSNHGMVLLAHIVEVVSGMPFDAYINKNLYIPLGMNNSGFSYSDTSIKNMMTRYKWKEDEDDVLYLDDSYGIKYTHQIGAGGFQTTANNMNHFMQMYLNKGLFNNTRILNPETIQNALNPHFYYHPMMDRKQGLTWRVRNSKGVTYNYHSGEDTGIESIVVLFPDSDIAYFFASNNNESNELKFKIRDLLIDRIKKEETKKSSKEFISNTNLEDVTGTYQYMNDGQSSVERLFSYLFGDVYQVTVDNNTLSINGEKYDEIDSLLFQRKKSGGLLVNFIVDEYGSHYTTGYSTYRRLASYEKPSLHIKLLIASFILFIVSSILWSIKYIKSKKINKARLYIGLSTLSLILFFVLLATVTRGGTAKYGVPTIFYFCFTLPLIAILFSIIGLLKAPKIFLDTSISLFSKLHVGLVFIFLFISLLIYNYYNIIGYNF